MTLESWGPKIMNGALGDGVTGALKRAMAGVAFAIAFAGLVQGCTIRSNTLKSAEVRSKAGDQVPPVLEPQNYPPGGTNTCEKACSEGPSEKKTAIESLIESALNLKPVAIYGVVVISPDPFVDSSFRLVDRIKFMPEADLFLSPTIPESSEVEQISGDEKSFINLNCDLNDPEILGGTKTLLARFAEEGLTEAWIEIRDSGVLDLKADTIVICGSLASVDPTDTAWDLRVIGNRIIFINMNLILKESKTSLFNVDTKALELIGQNNIAIQKAEKAEKIESVEKASGEASGEASFAHVLTQLTIRNSLDGDGTLDIHR